MRLCSRRELLLHLRPALADLRHGKSNPSLGLRQTDPTGKSLLIFRNGVKPRNQKYFCFRLPQISCISLPVSFPLEGRIAIVTDVERDAVDAAASGERMQAGRMMLKRTAKSCGSGAPGLASSLREEAQATVATKPGHRGDHEVSRKTIARGMPGDFRCTCGDYTRVLSTLHTRLRVHWAPGIPCALCLSRAIVLQNLGRIALRECAVTLFWLFENRI
jgi:hypothetical protein